MFIPNIYLDYHIIMNMTDSYFADKAIAVRASLLGHSNHPQSSCGIIPVPCLVFLSFVTLME